MPGRGGAGNFKAVAAKNERDSTKSISSAASVRSHSTQSTGDKHDLTKQVVTIIRHPDHLTPTARSPGGGRRGFGNKKHERQALVSSPSPASRHLNEHDDRSMTSLSVASSRADSASMQSAISMQSAVSVSSSADLGYYLHPPPLGAAGRATTGTFHSHIQAKSSSSSGGSKSDLEDNNDYKSSGGILVTRELRIEVIYLDHYPLPSPIAEVPPSGTGDSYMSSPVAW